MSKAAARSQVNSGPHNSHRPKRLPQRLDGVPRGQNGMATQVRHASERSVCWMLAFMGSRLLHTTRMLARYGILSHLQSRQLLQWSTKLQKASIGLLRRGRW